MNIHLQTQRFILRDIEENDVDGLFALDSDPEVHAFLGKKPIHSKQQALKVIRFIRKQYKDNGIARWAIEDKKNGDFVGWTGLKYEQHLREGMSYYDIGYRLRKKYWRQGIGYETALACLKYGFEKLNLEEISAAAHVDNIASNRILTKIGLIAGEVFSCDGALHNWYSLKCSGY